MAGYLRKLISLEQALKEVIRDLKDSGLKEATNKSESHFRKCSDEKDKDHNIHHQRNCVYSDQRVSKFLARVFYHL
jgi:hypothetical protein